MSGDFAPAEMHEAAAACDPGADATLSQWYQQRYPESQESGPPVRSSHPFALENPPAQLTEEELEEGVPPQVTGYALPGALTDAAPHLAGEIASWAHRARMTVAATAELGRLVADRIDAPELPAEVIRGQAEHAIAQLAAEAGGQRILERARAAWARLEQQRPELAELFDQLDLATDRRFLELLARTWRP